MSQEGPMAGTYTGGRWTCPSFVPGGRRAPAGREPISVMGKALVDAAMPRETE